MTVLPEKFLRKSPGLGAALAGWLLLLSPRSARADNDASYKYEDYREADGRISVKTHSALFEQDLGPDTHLKVLGVIDTIAGATPNGQPAPAGSDQVVLTTMNDRRKAWNGDLAHQFKNFNVDVGVANSRESDYTSTGWSLNTLTDFNEKNTTFLAGIAGTSDEVKVFYQSNWAKKRTAEAIVGLTQLIDAHTSVTLNLSVGHATGYLSDPYKLVQKSIEVGPGVFLPFTFGENRPDERTKWTAFISLNHDYAAVHGALEASYRFYRDNFGTTAHTLEASWFQHLGPRFILKPGFRFYDQTAADFYYYQLDQTSIIPVSGVPNPSGPFFSSDYRLSALRSSAYSLKAVWMISTRWQIDVDFTRYEMRGRDGQTPQSAYPRADIVTAGARLAW